MKTAEELVTELNIKIWKQEGFSSENEAALAILDAQEIDECIETLEDKIETLEDKIEDMEDKVQEVIDDKLFAAIKKVFYNYGNYLDDRFCSLGETAVDDVIEEIETNITKVLKGEE